MFWINFIDIVFLAIILMISISVHEFAHAWVSYKLGDPTPKFQWRLTLNPLVHIDPIWFLMIFLIHFWWWRPVEVNPSYYRNPLFGELLVALAGPFSNLVLAFVWSFFIVIFYKFFGVQYTNSLLHIFLMDLVLINSALFVFNLLPFPPLDGYRLIKFFFPALWEWIDKNFFRLSIFFFILIFTPLTWNVIKHIITSVSWTITMLFNFFWSLVLF